MQHLLDYVHEHLFEQELNVSHARQACGIKDHNVSSRFKLYVGRGVRSYIEDLHLAAAMRLLWHRELDIYLIASSVGYKYHESFTRAFKRCTKYTPTGFRESIVADHSPSMSFHRLTGRSCLPRSVAA